MATWKDGVKDAVDICDELIEEYKTLKSNQEYRIKQGSGSSKLAIDYSMVIAALQRAKDCLKDLREPEVQENVNV
jgi:hypothetical protein